MENRNELLEKLGYSKEYLQMLEQGSLFLDFEKIIPTPTFVECIIDSNRTSLIIDSTAKPINNHFIYNEK